MPGLSQEQLTAISIRLTALNWDEVQLLPWPFWHVGREEDKNLDYSHDGAAGDRPRDVSPLVRDWRGLRWGVGSRPGLIHEESSSRRIYKSWRA